jgi:hypothetical protein
LSLPPDFSYHPFHTLHVAPYSLSLPIPPTGPSCHCFSHFSLLIQNSSYNILHPIGLLRAPTPAYIPTTLSTFWLTPLATCLAYSFTTLKMEPIHSSQMSTNFCHITWCHVPRDNRTLQYQNSSITASDNVEKSITVKLCTHNIHKA